MDRSMQLNRVATVKALRKLAAWSAGIGSAALDLNAAIQFGTDQTFGKKSETDKALRFFCDRHAKALSAISSNTETVLAKLQSLHDAAVDSDKLRSQRK